MVSSVCQSWNYLTFSVIFLPLQESDWIKNDAMLSYLEIFYLPRGNRVQNLMWSCKGKFILHSAAYFPQMLHSKIVRIFMANFQMRSILYLHQFWILTLFFVTFIETAIFRLIHPTVFFRFMSTWETHCNFEKSFSLQVLLRLLISFFLLHLLLLQLFYSIGFFLNKISMENVRIFFSRKAKLQNWKMYALALEMNVVKPIWISMQGRFFYLRRKGEDNMCIKCRNICAIRVSECPSIMHWADHYI